MNIVDVIIGLVIGVAIGALIVFLLSMVERPSLCYAVRAENKENLRRPEAMGADNLGPTTERI